MTRFVETLRRCPKCDRSFKVDVLEGARLDLQRLSLCPDCLPKPKPPAPEMELERPQRTGDDV